MSENKLTLPSGWDREKEEESLTLRSVVLGSFLCTGGA
jgi:hypothetical protein